MKGEGIMAFNHSQTSILLRRINPSRIEKRTQAGMKLSYLSQHDVRAHLIRVFGFGGFDLETLEANLAFEHESDGKWSVGYQVTMRLTVKDEHGTPVCTYSETAVGTSTQGRRGEAHDMAMKTASSDAMKRCAINLGDQFGLSLYDNGSTSEIVKAVLVGHEPQDAVSEPTHAPVSDETPAGVPEEGSEPSKPSEEALEARGVLSGYALLAPRQRITEVAKFKAASPHLLNTVIDIDGQEMTIARFADLVASGRYSQEERDGLQD